MIRCEDDIGDPSPNFHYTPAGGRVTLEGFNLYQARRHGGSSVQSCLEPATIRSQNRDCRKANAALSASGKSPIVQ
ncbi:hypothetical protein AVEN_253132-1 [Araneus ventricosus]|uniref:Uncharacterized protein n=1 Tax=Araneus ventricosus TaxID=182803 RepID=A0A4Y2HEG1_ARAVE|nr:hypothetical protein AVEN_253132-1 [Araneus ventricosus]